MGSTFILVSPKKGTGGKHMYEDKKSSFNGKDVINLRRLNTLLDENLSINIMMAEELDEKLLDADVIFITEDKLTNDDYMCLAFLTRLVAPERLNVSIVTKAEEDLIEQYKGQVLKGNNNWTKINETLGKVFMHKFFPGVGNKTIERIQDIFKRKCDNSHLQLLNDMFDELNDDREEEIKTIVSYVDLRCRNFLILSAYETKTGMRG